jgi:hypothetical protein
MVTKCTDLTSNYKSNAVTSGVKSGILKKGLLPYVCSTKNNFEDLKLTTQREDEEKKTVCENSV